MNRIEEEEIADVLAEAGADCGYVGTVLGTRSVLVRERGSRCLEMNSL